MSRIVKVSGIVAAVLVVLLGAFAVWMHRALELPEPPTMIARFVSGPPRLPVGEPPDLKRRVFLDVNGAAPDQVFQTLARTIGCTLTLDRGVRGRVTLRLSNVTARTALSAICESLGCRWQVVATDLQVDATAPPPPIPAGEILEEKLRQPLPAIRFRDVAFAQALERISEASEIAFTVDNVDPATRVTADVTDDQPLIGVFKIIRAAGWSFTGSGRIDTTRGAGAIHLVPDKRLQ